MRNARDRHQHLEEHSIEEQEILSLLWLSLLHTVAIYLHYYYNDGVLI